MVGRVVGGAGIGGGGTGGAGGPSTINVSAGTTSNNLSALTFGDAGGVSFGLNGSVITAVAPAAGGGLTNIRVSAGTTSNLRSDITFNNGGGVTFGLDAGVITATVQTNYLTTAMASNRGSDFVQATAAFAGTNASGTIASNGISVSVGNYITTARASNDAVGLNTAQTNVTWTVNSSGISLNASRYAGTGFTSTTTAGTEIEATNNTLGLSMAVPAFLTTAALSNHSHGNPQLNLTNLSGTTASNSAGFTLSLSAAAAGAAQTGISGIIVSDATYTSGTVSFSNAGNITISSSVNGASQYIRLSGNAAQTVQTQNFIAAIVSGGNGDGTFTSGTLSVKAGNNITLSTGANVFSIHGVAAQTVQTQNMVVVEGNGANGVGTFSSGTLDIHAGNNITLSTGAQALSIHGVAAQTVQTQASGNIPRTGFTTTTQAGAVIAGTHDTAGLLLGVPAYLTTAALSNHSHGNPQLNLTNLSGTTASNSAGFTLSLSAGNYLTTARASNDAIGLNTAQSNVTWTVNSSGLSLDARGYAGTGTAATNATLTLNSGGISVSVAPPGITAVNLSAGTTSNNLTAAVFSASNGVQFGLNGSTITAIVGSAWARNYPEFVSYAVRTNILNPRVTTGATGGSTQLSVGSLSILPVVFPLGLMFNQMFVYIPTVTTAGTGSNTVGHYWGLYTLNGGSALSLISTAQFVMLLSQNSVTARTAHWYWGTNSNANSSSTQGNASGVMSGTRMAMLSTGANSIPPGQYYMMYGVSNRTSGLDLAGTNHFMAYATGDMPDNTFPVFGGTTVPIRQDIYGTFSTTTNTNSLGFGVFPASIHTSVITTLNASTGLYPVINFKSYVVGASNT